MIEIIYDRNEHRVTAKGHAGAGKPGQDIVCAAVSVLMETLAATVERLCSGQQARSPVVVMEPGCCEVGCKPAQRYRYTITLMLNTVCTGFELVARDYPEYVSYRVQE